MLYLQVQIGKMLSCTPEIKLQRALLLYEDENDASEMNFKLTC